MRTRLAMLAVALGLCACASYEAGDSAAEAPPAVEERFVQLSDDEAAKATSGPGAVGGEGLMAKDVKQVFDIEAAPSGATIEVDTLDSEKAGYFEDSRSEVALKLEVNDKAAPSPPPPPPPAAMATPVAKPKPAPSRYGETKGKSKKKASKARRRAKRGVKEASIEELVDAPEAQAYYKFEFKGDEGEQLEVEEEESALDDDLPARDAIVDGLTTGNAPTDADGRFLAGKANRAQADGWTDQSGEIAPEQFAALLANNETRNQLLDESKAHFWHQEAGQVIADDPNRFVEPESTIPRMCYFENTYLGGNAAYAERLRRLDTALGGDRPHRRASLPVQAFDAPTDAGLALTATLDRSWVDRPQRVFLQIGLQGSKRFGWRRPPLDIALVVDRTLLDDGGELLIQAITSLSRRLGPQDRLGVVLAAQTPQVIGELSPLRDRLVLARAIEALDPPPGGGAGALGDAMLRAGALLTRAAGDQARIPGTQTVLVLTDGSAERVAGAAAAAHQLTVQGAVTSVIHLEGDGAWWTVANAGHGNQHRASRDQLDGAIEAELSSISRVIARLLRLNIKLGPDVEAIRVIGAKVLGQEEVAQVKAREEATDRNLSKTLGVKADRGDDDDGIQTVIPYFYGGDSHVVLVELWVKGPGAVADVTLKYKDMVALENATARAAADVARFSRPPSPAERRVAANVRGFQLAEGLGALADTAARADQQTVLTALGELRPLARGDDRALLAGFQALVQRRGADDTVAAALRMARDRRLGQPGGP